MQATIFDDLPVCNVVVVDSDGSKRVAILDCSCTNLVLLLISMSLDYHTKYIFYVNAKWYSLKLQG